MDDFEILLNGKGETISELLREAGMDVGQPCGGKGRCGKCRVRARGALSECTAQELQTLGLQALDRGMRLACCARVHGSAHVQWSEKEQGAAVQIRTDGATRSTGFYPAHRKLGAAIDLGTTTLAAQLLEGDRVIASASALNPQRSFGADVISRIGCALEGNAAALASCVREAIAQLMRDMCAQLGRSPREIDAVVITGNTAMLYLLTQTDVAPLSRAPFEIDAYLGRTYCAGELGLPCTCSAEVYLPRCMSAFVGADISTALLASGMCERGETALLADIGTNGELALWNKGQLLCCSTAAGPAFEGANLSCGMQGGIGAIDHAWSRDGRPAYHVIGDVAPTGICGSGIADLIAVLLQLELIDETGYYANDEDAYVLAEGVYITQRDIRQIQLAKSAVCAGMRTLLKQSGVKPSDVHRLELAGGFGSFLSIDSAAAIGLIPAELQACCRVLGNAALSGAAMLLKDVRLREQTERLAERAQIVELASNPMFMDYYIEGMKFDV